jgi:hypothetical protein
MSTDIDLLMDVAPASQELGAVADMAQRMNDLEAEILQLEETIKQKKQELKMLAEHDLPDLMQELNIRSFELNDGSKVEVKDVIQASIPSSSSIERQKEESVRAELLVLQAQCFDWLRSNGGADLIKSSVEVQFGRDEDAIATAFTESLRDQHLNYKRATSVHPQTLNSFMRERLSDGKEVPMDLFRIYTGRRANIRR